MSGEVQKSVENLFLRILRLGKILGQNPGVSVVPDAADQIDRGVVAGKAGCLDIEKSRSEIAPNRLGG